MDAARRLGISKEAVRKRLNRGTLWGRDGEVMYKTTGEAESHTCPTGTTWYIPGGVEDAAINEGNTLMSSLIIEFVPVEQTATPTS